MLNIFTNALNNIYVDLIYFIITPKQAYRITVWYSLNSVPSSTSCVAALIGRAPNLTIGIYTLALVPTVHCFRVVLDFPKVTAHRTLYCRVIVSCKYLNQSSSPSSFTCEANLQKYLWRWGHSCIFTVAYISDYHVLRKTPKTHW